MSVYQEAFQKLQKANPEMTQDPTTASREPHAVHLTSEESQAVFEQLCRESALADAACKFVTEVQMQRIAPGLFQEGHLRVEAIRLLREAEALAARLGESLRGDYAMILTLADQASR